MATFLTVKEASQLTGKSPSSIRRIVYPIIRNDAHPDRSHIQPTAEEVLQLRIKGDNFAWRLSEELLRREIPVEAEADRPSAVSAGKQPGQAEGQLLATLRGELDIKNQQIAQQSELIGRQMELISGLSERLREGNVLIASLQQRFALPQGRGDDTAITVTSRRPASRQPKKGSTIAANPAKPKRSFLSWLLSSHP